MALEIRKLNIQLVLTECLPCAKAWVLKVNFEAVLLVIWEAIVVSDIGAKGSPYNKRQRSLQIKVGQQPLEDVK